MIVALIDIGSGSVGAGLARVEKGVPPVLFSTTRVAIPFQTELEGARFESRMLQALSEAVSALAQERLPEDEVFVSLAAPWVSAQTTHLSLRSEEALTVTPSLLARLRESEESERTHGEQIEEKLFRVRLNGYETAAPFGQGARTAEFALFKSFTPPGLAGRIEAVIERHLHRGPIHFHAFSLIAFASLREVAPTVRDFLILDAGGEQTEAVVVKNGALREVVSIPFGRNHLIRALVAGGALPSVVGSMLRLLAEGSGAGVHLERTGARLREALRLWGQEVGRALGETLSASARLFLFADSDILPLFAGELRGRARLTEADAALFAHPDPFLATQAIVAGLLRKG